MSTLTEEAMREFLSHSISSLNRNKLNGLMAEVELRHYLKSLGFGDRISPGGWIVRREGAGEFGHHTVVFFPEVLNVGERYPLSRSMPVPTLGLHTICATFHQTGIAAYFCAAQVAEAEEPNSIIWFSKQLGLPVEQPYRPFPSCLESSFRARGRKFKFLRYDTNTNVIPSEAIKEEFSKESVRIAFQNAFMSEISDVDGIFWGQQFTYPLEIKEKTQAVSRDLGPFFGLDMGPFVKLAFYAAKRGNLHSLFIVREIDSIDTRKLVNWWFITYEQLAQFASWKPQGGGTSMIGGQSSVVRIPKAEFQPLNANTLRQL